MFVLQLIQNAATTYTPYGLRSEALAVVRGNYGLTQSEYDEFLVQGYFERPELYLYIYEGEVPVFESAMSMRAQKALHVQSERLAKKR